MVLFLAQQERFVLPHQSKMRRRRSQADKASRIFSGAAVAVVSKTAGSCHLPRILHPDSHRHLLKLGSSSLPGLNIDYNIRSIAFFKAMLFTHFFGQKINDSGFPVRRMSVFETN